jgi:hypothetical protein
MFNRSKEGAQPASGGGWAWGALLLVLAVHAGLLVAKLRRDEGPIQWDQSVHMRSAWSYHRALQEGRPSVLLHPPHAPGHPPYPPLTHVLMIPWVRVADTWGFPVEDAATLVNVFFMGLLALGVFLLASDSWGEGAGAAAATMALCLPPVRLYAGDLLVDVPLTAWVSLSYAAWVRSRSFHLRIWCLLLGLFCAAGLMTKFTFPLYILPIPVHAAWVLLRRRKEVSAYHVLGVFLLAGLLAAPWYLANIVTLTAKVSRAAGLGAQEGDPTGGFAAWLFYGGVLQHWVGWTGVLILVGTACWLAVSRPAMLGLLAAWFFSGYAAWSLVSNKDPRYLLPAAMALPVAAASLPFKLHHLLAGAMMVGTVVMDANALKTGAHPAWPLQDILRRAVESRRDPEGPAPVLTLLANHASMNGNNVLWTAEREGLEEDLIVRSRSSRLGEFSEFVVVKTGDLGPARTVAGHERLRAEALRAGGWFQRRFENLAAWPLPDGSQAFLFQRKAPVATAAAPADAGAALSSLLPGISTETMTVRCGASSVAGLEDCSVASPVLSLKGLPVRDLRVRLEGFWVVPDDEKAPRILGLKTLRIEKLTLTEADVARYLTGRVKGLQKTVVRFEPGNLILIEGRWKGLPLRVRASIQHDAVLESVRVELKAVRLAGIPLPVPGGRREFSLKSQRGMPYAVVLSGVKTVPAAQGGEGALEVSP